MNSPTLAAIFQYSKVTAIHLHQESEDCIALYFHHTLSTAALAHDCESMSFMTSLTALTIGSKVRSGSITIGVSMLL